MYPVYLAVRAQVSEESANTLLEELLSREASARLALRDAHGREEDRDDDYVQSSSASDLLVKRQACRLALSVSSNHLDAARVYLQSNIDTLQREAATQLGRSSAAATAAAARDSHAAVASEDDDRTVAGVWFNKHTKLQVNMQTGEMVVGGHAMLPVPTRVSVMPSFSRNMPSEVPLCSIVAADEDGEWFNTSGDQRPDGAEYDFFAHRATPAKLPEFFRAKLEREQLRTEMARGHHHSSGGHGGGVDLRGASASDASELCAAVLSLLEERRSKLPFLPNGVDVESFATRCVAALEELGVHTVGELGFLREEDAAVMAAHLPEMRKPVHRRHFLWMLGGPQGSGGLHGRRDLAVRKRHNAAGSTAGGDGPWLLGGLDERNLDRELTHGFHALPPEDARDSSDGGGRNSGGRAGSSRGDARFAPGVLRQDEGGLRWCGHYYEPYRPHLQRVHEEQPKWLERFERKLYEMLYVVRSPPDSSHAGKRPAMVAAEAPGTNARLPSLLARVSCALGRLSASTFSSFGSGCCCGAARRRTSAQACLSSCTAHPSGTRAAVLVTRASSTKLARRTGQSTPTRPSCRTRASTIACTRSVATARTRGRGVSCTPMTWTASSPFATARTRAGSATRRCSIATGIRTTRGCPATTTRRAASLAVRSCPALRDNCAPPPALHMHIRMCEPRDDSQPLRFASRTPPPRALCLPPQPPPTHSPL